MLKWLQSKVTGNGYDDIKESQTSSNNHSGNSGGKKDYGSMSYGQIKSYGSTHTSTPPAQGLTKRK